MYSNKEDAISSLCQKCYACKWCTWYIWHMSNQTSTSQNNRHQRLSTTTQSPDTQNTTTARIYVIHLVLMHTRETPLMRTCGVRTCTEDEKLYPGADPGFVVRGGAWVGEGSEDRLRSPAGPRQSPGRGHRGAKPLGSSGGLRN